MTSRERLLATIRREPVDRIPTAVICIENQPEIAAHLGVPEAEVMARLGIDGREVFATYAGEKRPEVLQGLYTEWGTPNTGDYGTARFNPLAEVSSLAAIERYPWPDPAQYDYATAAANARRLRDYAVRGPYWQPVFCRACDLFGMENALMHLLDEPVLIEAVLERTAAFTHDYCVRLLDACGDDLPILCLADDFATQRGLMVSPAVWRRFIKPHLARLFALGKSRGKFVWFHSCGDITAVLPDLIDIGMDVWETVQLHTLPIDARTLKREYGRHLTFFGAISTQRLPFATPDEVRAEVTRCIDVLGEGGGYICGPDHHIKPDVPPANTVALFEAARSYRRLTPPPEAQHPKPTTHSLSP